MASIQVVSNCGMGINGGAGYYIHAKLVDSNLDGVSRPKIQPKESGLTLGTVQVPLPANDRRG